METGLAAHVGSTGAAVSLGSRMAVTKTSEAVSGLVSVVSQAWVSCVSSLDAMAPTFSAFSTSIAGGCSFQVICTIWQVADWLAVDSAGPLDLWLQAERLDKREGGGCPRACCKPAN